MRFVVLEHCVNEVMGVWEYQAIYVTSLDEVCRIEAAE
jgi:hypothetical protein